MDQKGDDLSNLLKQIELLQKNNELLQKQLESSHLIRESGDSKGALFLKDEKTNSHLHYKTLLESSPDVYMQVNRNLEIEYLHFPGMPSVEHLIGKKIVETVNGIDAQYVADKVQNVFDTGIVDRYEIEGPNAYGQAVWYDTMLIPIKDDKGKTVSVYCVSRDISDKKRAELKIRINEAKLHALFDSSPDCFILFDLDFSILWYNKEAANYVKAVTGVTMQVGMPASEIMLPDFKDRYYDALRLAVSHQTVDLERHVRIEGREDFWVETRIAPVYDKEHQLIGVSAKLIDISARKKNELMLKDREAKLKAIFDSSRHVQYLLDETGRLIWFNKAANESFVAMGYGSLKAGDRFGDFLPPEQQDYYDELIRGCLSGTTHHEEVKTVRQDKPAWFEIIFRPCYDANDQLIGVFHVSWDITDRKESEAELIKNNQLLFQQNRQLNEYSHIVSHNLRGPVASLLGLTTLLQMSKFEGAELDKMIESVKKAAVQLDKIIGDLNEILSVTQEVEQVSSNVKLEDIVTDIKNLLKDSIQAASASIETDFTAISEIVTVKPFTYSIFMNLISNSLKYRKQYQSPVVKISTELVDEFVMIKFEDNCLGIDMEKNREKLFVLYKRFHPNTDGKGLGLHLVKSHVDMLGGKIEVESEVNVGTTFRIYLKN